MNANFLIFLSLAQLHSSWSFLQNHYKINIAKRDFLFYSTRVPSIQFSSLSFASLLLKKKKEKKKLLWTLDQENKNE